MILINYPHILTLKISKAVCVSHTREEMYDLTAHLCKRMSHLNIETHDSASVK